MNAYELGRGNHTAIWDNPVGATGYSWSRADYADWINKAVQASSEYPELTCMTTQSESLTQSAERMGLLQYPSRESNDSDCALFIKPEVLHIFEHKINIGQLHVDLKPRIPRGIGEAEWDSSSKRWDGLGDAGRRVSGAISSIDEALNNPVTPYDHDVPPGFVWDDKEYIQSLEALLRYGRDIIHPILPWVNPRVLQGDAIQSLLGVYAQGISDITSPISVECGYADVDELGWIDYRRVAMSSYFLPQWYTKLSGSASVDSMDNPIGASIHRLETGEGLFDGRKVRHMRPIRPDTADYMKVRIGTKTKKCFQFAGLIPLPGFRTVYDFQHADIFGVYEKVRKTPGTSMVQLFADMRSEVVSLALSRMQQEAKVASEYLTKMFCGDLNVGYGDRTMVRKYVQAFLSSFPASLASLP